MKFTRAEVHELQRYCLNKLVAPKLSRALREKISQDVTPPEGLTVPSVYVWWKGTVDIDLSEDELRVLAEAIYYSTAQSDCPLAQVKVWAKLSRYLKEGGQNMNGVMTTDQVMPMPAASPADIIAAAQEQARAMMDVVESQRLYQSIRGKKFLCVEGWQLLASFSGLTPIITKCRPVSFDDVRGWEATCELRDREGRVVASASAVCCDDEPNWRGKPQYQLRSMAQTRAISKTIRTKLSFVAVLAGYEPTPAEEMDGVSSSAQPAVPTPAEDHVEPEDRARLFRQLFAVAGECGLLADEYSKEAFADRLRKNFGVHSRQEMNAEMIRKAIQVVQLPEFQEEVRKLAAFLRYGNEDDELPF